MRRVIHNPFGGVTIEYRDTFYDDDDNPISHQTTVIGLTKSEWELPEEERERLIACYYKDQHAKRKGPSWSEYMEMRGRVNNPLRELKSSKGQ